MKKTLVLLLLAATAAAEPFLPADPKGQVTLSWDKFNNLWDTLVTLQKKVETLETPEVAPPVPFALSGGAYRGTVLPDRVDLEAVYALEVFEPKAWVKVPFLPASTAVTGAQVDGKPFGLVQENGMHTAVIRGAGRHTLRVTLSLRTPKGDEAPALAIPVPRTAMTALSLLFPQPGLEVTVDGAQGQETRSGKDGTRVTAALPPTERISFRWQQALPAQKLLPRKLYVQSEALFTASEGALRGRWTLHYTVLHQGLQKLAVALPAGWNVLSVSADGSESWKTEDGPEGPRLLVDFTYPRKGLVTLTVEAERGLADKEAVVPLPRLAPLDVERETGLVAIQAKGSVELAVPEAAGVQGLDPQELPASVWTQAQHPILYAFRHTGRPGLSLGITRHPDVAVLTTTVDLANALTMMTKRGETVTRVQYHVRNRVKQHLAVKLPEGAELWSAFVAGEPVKPAKLPDGGYRLPLRRSAGGNGADAALVEIVYFARRAPAGLMGRRSFDLPLPDAPVTRALWSLYLPPQARPLAFGGDMDPAPAFVPQPLPAAEPAMSPRPIRMMAGLARKARSLLGKEADEREAEMPAAALQFQERLLTDSLEARDDAPRRAGVFPVYFQIPEEGALYHFGRAMIVGESPRMTVTYAAEKLFGFLWAALWTALAVAAFRMRKRFAPYWNRGMGLVFRREEA